MIEHKGTIELFAHIVDYCYWGLPKNTSQEILNELDINVEQQITEMISNSYVEGELRGWFISKRGKYHEFRGYWNIRKGTE